MRIGFVAMSGLRMCKPELLELGFSFPSVERRAHEIEALPSLGLLTLAGMTPHTFESEYLEVRDVDHDAVPERFDVVAISTLTATSKEAYRLASRFRAIGTTVIMGGLHVTLQPEEASPFADAIVVGEGEVVWPEVLEDLARGTLKQRYDARSRGPFDLSRSPVPRFDLLVPDRYPRFGIQTQRGCPWSCEFCASSIRLSPTFRVKPVDKVIAEIRMLKETFRRPFVEFADDNTFVNRKHSRKLMAALAREDVRWFSETDLSVADDPDLLSMMRDAGCAQVLIGFESPSYDALNGVEQNANWKARRIGRYMDAVENIQRHGITVNGCFIMGMDGTGRDSFANVARFVRESGLYDVQITYLTPFPGTPLYERLRAEGRIIDECATEKCTLFDVNFIPQQMSVSDLEEGFVRLAALLYGEKSVRDRSRRFKSHLRRKVFEADTTARGNIRGIRALTVSRVPRRSGAQSSHPKR